MSEAGENGAFSVEMGQCACGGVTKAPQPGDYKFEQDLIDDVIMKPDNVIMAAILDKDGGLKAHAPASFLPERQGVKDVITAFKGDTGGLAERCLNFGCGSNMSTPGKMDDNSIIGNDGKGGGCTVMKTKEDTLLIIIYNGDPAHAGRMGRQARGHLEENGR